MGEIKHAGKILVWKPKKGRYRFRDPSVDGRIIFG
jgi:hypothetical protein